MRYAFIGGGAMAEAMLKGMTAQGIAAPADVTIAEPVPARREYLAATYGVATVDANERAAAEGEIVVLAVKPQMLDKVGAQIAGRVPETATVLSILAGARVAALQSALSHQAVIRVMPNTPAQIGMGMSVWMATDAVPDPHRAAAATMLQGLGEQREVHDEHYLDMATALSGGGPAYVALFVEALIDAGVATGLPRDVSRALAVQTVLGSAKLIQESGRHTAELRDMVTSPGGTTIAAVHVMEREGLRGIVMDAIMAAYRRSLELGGSS